LLTDDGWLPALREALARAPGAAAACPTLLHEDDAIRYAGGADAIGLPAAAIAAGAPRPADEGTLRCCLLTRAAAQAAGGFDRGFATLDAAAADFFRRARAQGGYCVWVPAVRVYALGDDGVDAPWRRNGRRVDAWALAARSQGPADVR
jgi:GT2 family glycosyltransferase